MTVDGDPDVATVTDLLGDEVVRTILAATVERPLSAAELSERCGVSEATVYRRLEQLAEADLVEARTEPDEEGHHYKVYAATVDRVVVDLTSEGLSVRVTRRQRMADRFTDFVEGLR